MRARPMDTQRRPGRWRSAVAVAAIALAAAGCGIRGTSVPVDAGPAPSRASCQVTGGTSASVAPVKATSVTVFLVCNTQIVSVHRSVPVAQDELAADRLRFARTLLEQLQRRPDAREEEAGFSTETDNRMRIDQPRTGDPDNALRLNRAPDDLPPYALAQLVCTYAGTAAVGGDRSVVLGGPAADSLRRYACTPGLRARPETAQTTGAPVR